MNRDKRNFILEAEAMFSQDRIHRSQPNCVESIYNPYCQHSRNKHLCHLELNKIKCEENKQEENKQEEIKQEEIKQEEIKQENIEEIKCIKFSDNQMELIINPSKNKNKFKW